MKDVDCALVQTLHPKTKFDAHEAMVTGLTFKSNGDLELYSYSPLFFMFSKI